MKKLLKWTGLIFLVVVIFVAGRGVLIDQDTYSRVVAVCGGPCEAAGDYVEVTEAHKSWKFYEVGLRACDYGGLGVLVSEVMTLAPGYEAMAAEAVIGQELPVFADEEQSLGRLGQTAIGYAQNPSCPVFPEDGGYARYGSQMIGDIIGQGVGFWFSGESRLKQQREGTGQYSGLPLSVNNDGGGN